MKQGHKISNHLSVLCLTDWLREGWEQTEIVCPLVQVSQRKIQTVKLTVEKDAVSFVAKDDKVSLKWPA